jgi:lysophospholipase L1-like esterase
MRGAIRRMHLAAIAVLFALLGASAAAQRVTPADPWEADIQRFEAADRAQPPRPGGVVFIGSSSIRLWTTLAEDLPGANALNRGFGGSKIAAATRYVDRIVAPYRPRLVMLYAGDNDIAEGATAQQVLADFEAFVAVVRKDLPKTPIAFVSIKPSPARVNLIDTMREANTLIRDYAKRQRNVRYIDVFTPMLDKDRLPREDLFGPDRLHMNRSGYALWTSIIAPTLRR